MVWEHLVSLCIVCLIDQYDNKQHLDSKKTKTLASKLLQQAIEWAKKKNVKEIFLHVQSNNDVAVQFYKKFGFEKGELVQNYYKKIDPPHAYILSKKL